MRALSYGLAATSLAVFIGAAGCGDDEGGPGGDPTGGTGGSAGTTQSGTPSGGGGTPSGGGGTGATGGAGGTGGGTNPLDGPPAGNPYPEATCDVPPEAELEDVSNPRTTVGTGSPQSCSSSAFVDAVALGGVITFDCGSEPHTIVLDETAKIFNDTGPVVIDGGGLISLSGAGQRRILYQNTCDQAQGWTTTHCDNQDHPELTIQNLTFIDANSKSEPEPIDGGGAVFVRGGRFKVINCRFFNNVCADTGPDVGGAGVRVFDQYNDLPVYVVNSTFGGADGYGNTCSNGGGISSIGVSWTIINSFFSHNNAIGWGGNPTTPPDPGGGSGGAIYNDGNTMTLTLCGTRIEYNEVVQHGSAIFFVTNNHQGNIVIDRSNITNNVGGTWYPLYDQISCHSDTDISVTDSVIGN